MSMLVCNKHHYTLRMYLLKSMGEIIIFVVLILVTVIKTVICFSHKDIS